MVKLGVNIDHSATLRQARYREVPAGSKIIVEPNPTEIALLAENAGADSITAHLREDRRHINDSDIFALRENIRTKLNMEMSCAEDVVAVALRVKPDYVCLVPENRMEVTTEGGLDVATDVGKVASVVERLSEVGAVCSIFIDPEIRQIDACGSEGCRAPYGRVRKRVGRLCQNARTARKARFGGRVRALGFNDGKFGARDKLLKHRPPA